MATQTSHDLYRILQVEPQADLDTIRAAYRRLARLYHPDLNADPSAADHMRAINAAYAVLSDPARRAAYDARRFLPRVAPTAPPEPPPPPPRNPAVVRRRVVPPAANPPSALQRTVDRIVAVVGVALLIGIAFYAINVIPYAERQFQIERRNSGAAPRSEGVATAQAAARAPGGDHATSAAIAARLRDDGNLRSFPGTVLVPPQDLEPFASLSLQRTEATGQGIARYAVYYGDQSNGSASVSGLIGRQSFDISIPHLDGCDPDADYCAGLAPGESSGPPGLELFRPPDLIEGYPSFASHRVCCNGVFWSVSWYEPRTNMTYMISLSRGVAARFGSDRIEQDEAAARAVAGVATQLARLP